MKNFWRIVILVAVLAVIFFLIRKCTPDPIIKTETKTVHIPKIDTVRVVEFKDPDTVFVEKWKTRKGRDSLVYRDRPTDSSTVANRYDTTVKSDSATAHLKITTTGKLLDVYGTIEYPVKETITEITEKVPQSGLFLYAESAMLPTFKRSEVGFDFQWKNTAVFGTSISYENINKQVYINLKIGINIKKW